MNETIHVIGASGFFIVILVTFAYFTSAINTLWKASPGFIPYLSYLYKHNILKMGGILLGIDIISKIFRNLFPNYLGNVIEWVATFLVIIYVLTIALDMRKVSIYFVNSKFDEENKKYVEYCQKEYEKSKG